MTYAIVQDFLFPNIIYQRTSGDSIFRFNTTNNQDELFYDLSASPGDTINSVPNGSDTTDIILTWTGIRNIFGVNRRHWNFTIDLYRNVIDDEQYHVVTDSIGLRSLSIIFFIEAELQGAIINGLQYGTITNIERNVTAMPEHLGLYQNYPNPFNPSTTINYYINKSDNVKLNIYDSLGKLVKPLFNGYNSPGEYKVIWDGKNSDGIDVSAGTYFYQLITEYFQSSKKMILIK